MVMVFFATLLRNPASAADVANPCQSCQNEATRMDAPNTPFKVRVSVLGTGSLGKEHARIYAELAAAGQVDFIGVYDLAAETARKIAEKHRVRAFHSLAEAVADSDAVSIVTPTTTHYTLAKALLEQGKHV